MCQAKLSKKRSKKVQFQKALVIGGGQWPLRRKYSSFKPRGIKSIIRSQSMDYTSFLKWSTLTHTLYGILSLEDRCLYILLTFSRLGQHDCVLAGYQRIVLISISNFRHLSRLHGYVHRVTCSLVSEQKYDTLHLSSSFPLGIKHMAMQTTIVILSVGTIFFSKKK